MQKLTPVVRLQNAIHLLEIEREIKEQALREQISVTYEKLKPVNFLKGMVNDVISQPNIIESLLVNIVGMGTGYLSKKLVVGVTGNIFRKIFGSLLQFGITKLVSQHPDAVKSFGKTILNQFNEKKEST